MSCAGRCRRNFRLPDALLLFTCRKTLQPHSLSAKKRSKCQHTYSVSLINSHQFSRAIRKETKFLFSTLRHFSAAMRLILLMFWRSVHALICSQNHASMICVLKQGMTELLLKLQGYTLLKDCHIVEAGCFTANLLS